MLHCWPVIAAALSAVPAGPIAVVDVEGPPMMMGLAGQVTKTILDAAKEQGKTVVGPEELRQKLGDANKYEQLKLCGDRTGCVATLLSPLGIEVAVTGRLARDDKNYLVQLWLHDLGKLDVIAEVDRAILIASRRFQRDVEQAVPGLLRGEREARGTLVLKANVAGAQVFVNGNFVGAAPVTLQKKPGKYDVRFEKNKHLTVERLVAVEANQTSEESFTLLLKPGELPDDPDALPGLAVQAANEGAAGQAGRVTLTAPTILLGGFAAVALGVAIGFGVGASAADKKILDGFDATRMAYAATRSQALDAQRSATVANVAYGTAGLLGVAALVFLVLDLTRAPVQVAPSAGAGGYGVTLVGGLP